MKSTGLTTRCFSPVQRKPAKADFFCFRGKVPRRGGGFFPGGRQAAKLPIGRRGLRGAEVLPPWLRGGSPPQRKAPQGVKKARRRKRGTLWNADQNIVFTIIAKESTEGSPLFCFRKNCGGGGLFLAVRQQNAAPVFGRKRRGFLGTPPQVERLHFFSAGAQRGGFCVGVAAGFAQAKKISRGADFFLRRIFF